jgi:hypothetical protein
MKRTFLAAGIVALGCGLIFAPQQTSAQVTKQGNAYKMSLDLKKGSVYKYSIQATVNSPAGMGSQPTKQSFDSPITMKVMEVAGGLATVQITTVPPTMGATKAKPQTSTIKIDRSGKVTTGGEAGVVVSLPTKPVKIGETWSSTASTRGMGIPMNVNSKSTLKAVKAVGNRQVAVVEVTTDAKGASMTGKGKGTYTIDMKDGMIVTYDLAQTMTLTMPASASGTSGKPAKPMVMNIPTTMKMVRQ